MQVQGKQRGLGLAQGCGALLVIQIVGSLSDQLLWLARGHNQEIQRKEIGVGGKSRNSDGHCLHSRAGLERVRGSVERGLKGVKGSRKGP